MFLLSKTVINHVKSNVFSTSVITFFAGCSAFVQISTDNIKEIIDSSIKPYSIAPKNDMFIKTGSPDIYSGGSSFTVPVSVEVEDEKPKEGNQEVEIRYLTPKGWFVTYKNELAKERMGKLKDSKANYSGDYCVPMKGIKSIYTNYWFRPKIRFKGVWDAAITKDNDKLETASLIARDNKRFRKECADYTEEVDIENDFLGKMIHDYLKAYHDPVNQEYKNQNSLVVAIAGHASDKESETMRQRGKTVISSSWGMFPAQDEELKKKRNRRSLSSENNENNAENSLEQVSQKPEEEGNSSSEREISSNLAKSRGKREVKKQEEQPAFKKKSVFSQRSEEQSSETCDSKDSWEKNGCLCKFGSITANGNGNGGTNNKCNGQASTGSQQNQSLQKILKNGDMVGMSKDGGVIEQIGSGTEYERLISFEFTNKYRERKKAKLKIEAEEWLLSTQHLDIRKILQEFRKNEGQTELKLVQASNGYQSQQQVPELQQVNSVTLNDHQLWTPFEMNPWLKNLNDRQIKKKAGEGLEDIINKYRLMHDNQMMRFNPDPREEHKIKFNIHKSVQISNMGNSSAHVSDTSKTGHSFKVVSIEDVKERGETNPLVIIRGNPLFDYREDQEKLIRDFMAVYDMPFYSPWMVPLLRMISRAKFTDQEKDVRKTLQWWVAYLQYPWRDTWNIPEIKEKEYTPDMHRKLQIWLSEIQENTWSVSGARTVFNFTAYNRYHIVSKEMLPNLFVELRNFRMVGYIEQPTSYFTVISPEYARINGFEPISDQQYKDFRKLVNNLWLDQETWEEHYNKFVNNPENHKHLINVGDKKMIITGLGLTPELLYPAQSWISLQPDKTKEAVVYVDRFGFNDLKERGSVKWQEQYITVGFPEVIKASSKEEQKKYMEKLKSYIDEKLAENKDYYTLTKLGEEEGSDQLYSLRGSYIPVFQSRISAISYTLSGLIYAIVITLIIILVKRYIKSNMYLFGNFVANGMAKTDVLINVCLFTLLPLSCATMFGYLLSLLTQSTFYSIVSAYWFLNTRFSVLSLGNTLYFIFKVLSLVAPVAYFCSFWLLKDNASVLLKTTSGMKISKFNFFIYRLLYKISSTWKFRSVLLFNTLNQSTILSITSVIGFVFLNFFFHNHGKFSKVAEAEKATKNYGFEFELETPTKESGEFNLVSYANLGKGIDLMKETEQASSQDQQQTNSSVEKTFGVTKATDDRDYAIKDKKREINILGSIYKNYYGQFNGWWDEEYKKKNNIGDCDLHGALNHGTNGQRSSSQQTNSEGQHACLAKFGAFQRKNESNGQKTEWELWKNNQQTNSRKKRSPEPSSSQKEKTYQYFADNKPLFSFWNDYYNKKVKPNSQTTQLQSGQNQDNGWKKFNEKGELVEEQGQVSSGSSNGNGEYYLPTLKTLLDIYPNYWIISSRDYDIIESSMEFFRGKTLLRILLDINIEYVSDSGKLNYNVWDWTSKNLEKVQPVLRKMDEQNYDKFIESIVRSKYGPFFVSRFMTKHSVGQQNSSSTTSSSSSSSSSSTSSSSVGTQASSQTQSNTEQKDLSKLLGRQGELYQGKKTYYFKGTDIGRETQKTNQRNGNGSQKKTPKQDLKVENGNSNSQPQQQQQSTVSTATPKGGGAQNQEHKDYEDGLYYLDGTKIVVLNTSTIVDREIILMYDPEFLYLIFTAIADFTEQKYNGTGNSSVEPYTLPIKYTFGNVVHTVEKDELQAQQLKQVQSSSQEAEQQNLPPRYYFSTLKGRDEYLKNSSRRQKRQAQQEQDLKFDASKTPEGDQTYSWTKGKAKKDSQAKDFAAKIIGLKEDSRGAYYKLYSNGKLVNDKLYQSENNHGSDNNTYPLIVNRFAARQHNLKVGDLIKFTPENHYTRFTCQLKVAPKNGENGATQTNGGTNGNEQDKVCEYKNENGQNGWKNKEIKEHTLKVVEIFDSYYKEAYFMAQKDVNKIIGLNEHTGFNGIFTKNQELDLEKLPEQISLAFSSYSVSGIYTNVQQKLNNTAFRNLMNSTPPLPEARKKKKNEQETEDNVGMNRNFKILQRILGVNNLDYQTIKWPSQQSNGDSQQYEEETPTAQTEQRIEDLSRNYLANHFLTTFKDYESPMNSVIVGIMNNSIVSDVIFKNLSNLTDNVSYLFICLVLPLLVVSLITVIYLLIKDLESIFVTTKLLGFGNRENSMPIIVYLFALLFLSSFVGSCAVPAILNKYVNMLFTNQSILLPLVLSNGLMTGVFGLLAVIYFFSMFRSYLKIKGICLPVSIKLLVG
ncbi:Protein of unknown function DUF214, permase predicted [Mycoplasma suis KI3806]|uniref:Uncharacterized protein n=1 Tax=Mycoplasma suis (strain KI_3806) TaxID=708248 RepID=F0V286_MYCS3|nr:ABC transporter permease [Mycoplasma suis]CBZ40767.1 Protein of unknown function DUF214, permase predicted [Mycoplasma suis KI3806]